MSYWTYPSTPITREIERILRAQKDLEFAQAHEELDDVDFWSEVVSRRTENYHRPMRPQKDSEP